MATCECPQPETTKETRSVPLNGNLPWASVVWGGLLAAFVTRVFFSLRVGEFFENHDSHGYGLRLIEFRDCLWTGSLFPQWCSHFRGGLGAPFFNFYQPGFFYVASLTPASLPVGQQIGLAVFAFSLVGYLGMSVLIGKRFGSLAGTLAGTSFLTAPYIHTELYLRGDFSEYAAMMLVPGALSAFLEVIEHPSRRAAAVGAISLAAIVMTHPAIALALYGLLAIALLGVLVSTRSLRATIRGATLLGFGVGLSAVYWLPVFLESRYSSVERMWDGQIFEGYYHYSRHFLSLTWLIDQSVTKTPIPVKLGFFHTLMAGAGLAACVLSWKRFRLDQRHLAGLCVFILMASLFLMTRQSAWCWNHLPLLGRIQFPWRLLSLVSVSMASLSGVSVSSLPTSKFRPLAVIALAGLLLWPATNRANPKPIRYQEPRSAGEIAEQFFAPDLADEWLPRDARSFQISPEQRQPITQPPAVASDYQCQQGVLSCQLRANQKSAVILPHYFFPVGFTATLAGVPVEIGRTNLGLMRVEVPAGFVGTLRVTWSTTPAKRTGIIVSLIALGFGLGVLVRRLAVEDLPHQAGLEAETKDSQRCVELERESRQ